ncbi:MAG: FAD/NAD(P)-binding protein [Planctomycetaceae bacterium]|nr:FAD/NAD(P)-binding protein [Planctomycetaceae bacterium]
MTAIAPTLSKPSANPWLPKVVKIGGIQPEVPGIVTYQLNLANEHAGPAFSFRPGQFNMVYLPGIGEVPISISSDPTSGGPLLHTIRAAGSVTSALARKQVGDTLGLRGPFGSSWPTNSCKGHDVVIACGGVGLAPLRPAIYEIIRNRADYGRVFLLYGARTPGDLLFAREYDTWRNLEIEIFTTVDIGDARWRGNIGVVPTLFYRLRLEARRTQVMTCGPEIMIHFVVFEALARRIPRDRIHVSMERNMNCAIGHCGHCQFGPKFVCKDVPVFTYKELAPFMHTEDL